MADEDAVAGQQVKTEAPVNRIPLETPSDDLATLGATEILETDERPIFILNLTSPTKTIPVYYNQSLSTLR